MLLTFQLVENTLFEGKLPILSNSRFIENKSASFQTPNFPFYRIPILSRGHCMRRDSQIDNFLIWFDGDTVNVIGCLAVLAVLSMD